MADSAETSLIDSRSGFCKSNSTFYSKRKPLHLPANDSLDITTFISSLPHCGTTAYIDAATGQSLSFSDLWRAVDRVADGLHEIGIGKNDVVLILSPTSIYIPIVCLAVMSIGAIVTTANPLNTASEICKQMEDSNPVLAYTTSELAPKLVASPISIVLTSDEELADLPYRGNKIVGFLKEMMEKEQSEKRVRDRVNKDDTAMLLYSSGTTGESKGVISSHGNLIAHVSRFMVDPIKGDDIFLCTIPLFHTYGLLLFAMATVSLGITVVLLRKFEIHDLMAAIEKYRATSLTLVPPILVAMVNQADQIKAKHDLSSLKMVISGGAPLSKDIAERFIDEYPTVSIRQGYALTESNGAGSSIVSMEESRRYDSVGLLSSDLTARIVDPDSGRVMGVNQVGELLLKGPSIAKGYFKNEEATKNAVDSEGWLRTGDLCYIDDDGFLFIVDRLKEIIKYNGYQVPPAELEALLLTHPDILDAAVIPFPDKITGQYPMAYVVRKPQSSLTDKEVIDFISKQVAPYKKIRKVAFINPIPKNPSGKILRKYLVKLATSKL